MNKYHQLTREERYSITGLQRVGFSQAEIARQMGRSPSTISRELRRNSTTHDGRYRAEKAHKYARARRRRARRRSWFSPAQWQKVESLLRQKWSPEQISGSLRVSEEWSISHEAIYRYILRDKKAGGSLFKCMRIMPKLRRKRYNSKDSRGVLAGKRHISERSEAIEQRLQIGHWEGDTVIGQDKHHCILTLLERKTGYAVIKKLSARTTEQVTRAASLALIEQAGRFHMLTLDNGTEFHDYKTLEARFPLTCYFATPYHSWERGANENLNGLIRQYLPKGICMSKITQADCDWIANELNNRPRKRHQFKTPKEICHGSK
ncbi:IS30 family transposase [Uliginosibacterium aquaticum]|uniref:IS30 family transposase n=1 Tax=Uliginosibacterium aquaticum TaxID=2731212 RepID=A0ABX2IRM5_9RHOO|nr:IS30 family transposase [Uliginosibacterium aquaticum]NSL56873.1 IS30 family transposase [Uliginosibacterium aquaticum]